MILCFISFGIIAVFSVWLFANKEFTGAFVVTAIALVILGLGFVLYDYNISKTKVETLEAVGIEYLSKEKVYNKSQAELDKLFKITTLDGTYYYEIEKDN